MSEEQTANNEDTQLNSKGPKYVSCIEEITALVKGKVPIIWVLTHEENRFTKEFVDCIANPTKRRVWMWSSYQGLVTQGQENTTVRATGDNKDTWKKLNSLKQ